MSPRSLSSFRTYFTLVIATFFCSEFAGAQLLEQDLKRIAPRELADMAMREGDAARGAVVFFQPSMACSKCHSVVDGFQTSLGPHLANVKEPLTNESIVEAILEPSKSIRKGFESASVLTSDGETLTGLLVERTNAKVVLRDGNNQLVTVLSNDIENFVNQTISIMPAGQINQLTSQQQFLDLVRYLIEIRDGGVSRSKELQPSDALLTLKLPEYEERIDHIGLLNDWGQDSLSRGEAIYNLTLRAILEPEHHGPFVAIDIESSDYEVADEAHEASDQLRSRHPDAQILVERIGYPAAFRVRSSGLAQILLAKE